MSTVAVAVSRALARDIEEIRGAAAELDVLRVDPRVHDVGACVRARARVIIRVGCLAAAGVAGPVGEAV